METRSRRLPWLVAVSLLLLPATAAAWTGKVVGVADGDTITVLHNGQPKKVRLWGVECPEKHQNFGTKAKHITSTLVFAKMVEVDPVTTDRYRRTVALVRVGDIVVNEELIRQELARVFTRYCNRPICHAKSGSYWRPRHGRGSGASGQCRMRYRRGSSGEVGDDGSRCGVPRQESTRGLTPLTRELSRSKI